MINAVLLYNTRMNKQYKSVWTEWVYFHFSRYNIFKGCPKAKTCTIIVRGGAEQFMEETERSLHDAIMIVRRAIKVCYQWLTNVLIDLKMFFFFLYNWCMFCHIKTCLLSPCLILIVEWLNCGWRWCYRDGVVQIFERLFQDHPRQAAATDRSLRKSTGDHPQTAVWQRWLRCN